MARPKRKRNFGALRRRRKKRRRIKRLPLNGFPSSKMVRLRYCTEVSLTGSSTYVFRANSLFDPDLTGVGEQPANFGRWMAVYDHYTVVGSKIRVMYAPTTSTNALTAYCGIYLSDDGTSAAAMTSYDIMEQSKNRSMNKVIGIPSSRIPWITKTFSAKKFFGKPNSTMIGDGTYRGTDATNPTEGAYFELYTKSVGGNTPGTFNFMVYIDYIAVLTEAKEDEDA